MMPGKSVAITDNSQQQQQQQQHHKGVLPGVCVCASVPAKFVFKNNSNN